MYHDALAVAFASVFGYFDFAQSVEIVGCYGVLLQHLLGCTLEHHLSTTDACLRTYVHDIVGVEHHVAVVLHHNHGVAHVAQLLQRVYESVVVALMQSDARLVEDVEHVDELRANLRGKAYALALATR